MLPTVPTGSATTVLTTCRPGRHDGVHRRRPPRRRREPRSSAPGSEPGSSAVGAGARLGAGADGAGAAGVEFEGVAVGVAVAAPSQVRAGSQPELRRWALPPWPRARGRSRGSARRRGSRRAAARGDGTRGRSRQYDGLRAPGRRSRRAVDSGAATGPTACGLTPVATVSAAVGTIAPLEPCSSAASSATGSAQGTSAAAIRSTTFGSGTERPVAASKGMGRQIPAATTSVSSRPAERKRVGKALFEGVRRTRDAY